MSRRQRSAQQLRDDIKNQEFIDLVGEAEIQKMEDELASRFGPDFVHLKYILPLVKEVSLLTKVPLDRRTKRLYKMCIAWLVQNWYLVEDTFLNLAEATYRRIHQEACCPFPSPDISNSESGVVGGMNQASHNSPAFDYDNESHFDDGNSSFDNDPFNSFYNECDYESNFGMDDSFFDNNPFDSFDCESNFDRENSFQ